MGDQPAATTAKETTVPGKQRVQFDTPIGRITTIPLDQAKAEAIAAEAKAANATDVTVTDAQ